MDQTSHTITLFSSQSAYVWDLLSQEGVCFSRREYVQQKYGESAPIFLAVYDWFCTQAQKILPLPPGAQYPYWAFRERYSIGSSPENQIRALEIPMDQAIFFDVYDWNRILTLQYLGETPQEEQEFRRTLEAYGIRNPADVILTNFYPDLKRQVQQSWKRLFRYHEQVVSGNLQGIKSLQAALWQLKATWLTTG